MLSTVPGSPNTLSASWMAPDPTNGIVSGYTIYCSLTSSPELMLEPFDIGPKEASTILSGLAAFTEYVCTISATTGAGKGSLADPRFAVTAEDGKNYCVANLRKKCLCIFHCSSISSKEFHTINDAWISNFTLVFMDGARSP